MQIHQAALDLTRTLLQARVSATRNRRAGCLPACLTGPLPARLAGLMSRLAGLAACDLFALMRGKSRRRLDNSADGYFTGFRAREVIRPPSHDVKTVLQASEKRTR